MLMQGHSCKGSKHVNRIIYVFLDLPLGCVWLQEARHVKPWCVSKGRILEGSSIVEAIVGSPFLDQAFEGETVSRRNVGWEVVSGRNVGEKVVFQRRRCREGSFQDNRLMEGHF